MQRRMVTFEIPSDLVSEAEILAVQLRVELSVLACRAFTEFLWEVRTTTHGSQAAGHIATLSASGQQQGREEVEISRWSDTPDRE